MGIMVTTKDKFAPVFGRVSPFLTKLHQMEADGTYFWGRQLEAGSAAKTRAAGRDVILLASNNYLGLTTHPKVVAAAQEAVKLYGFGSGSARVLSGTMRAHRELEEKLAWFKGAEDCLLYSTGYMANVGLISSLVGPGDTVILDSLDHASIIDGARMSGARMRVFKHNNLADLRKKLGAVSPERLCLVVADGVFSMDGDLCDLPGLVQLSEKYGFILMLDDAHGTGVLGATGRGTCEHFHLEGRVDLVMGTLSKSLAGVGAFVTGSKDLTFYLRHASRPFIFNTSLPPAACAAASAAIDVLIEEPELLTRLRENADHLRNGLERLGFDTLDSSVTPIIPVLIGDEYKLTRITRRLFERGIMASAVIWPACRKNSSRLRMSVMATHTRDDLDYVLAVMEDIHREFGPFKYVREAAAENFIGLEEELQEA